MTTIDWIKDSYISSLPIRPGEQIRLWTVIPTTVRNPWDSDTTNHEDLDRLFPNSKP
jgi:hypothetical protein